MKSADERAESGAGNRLVRVGRPMYEGNWTTDAGSALPFVIAGEVVEAGAAGGLAVRVLETSVDRTRPGCVHFGVCGGCQYQHGVYSAQLEWKREILAGLLNGAGLDGLPAIEAESGPEWGYRNRIRLRVQREEGGGVRFGYRLRASHDFMPVRMCPIAAPVLWRAAETLSEGARDARLAAWLYAVAEVELFCAADESRMQAVFYTQDVDAAKRMAGGFHAMCERLKERIPELAGASAEVQPAMNRNLRRRWEGVSWGAAGLTYKAAGRNYWLPRGGFFQVNRFLVDRLVEMVAGDEGGGLAWDLFAGVGLFSRALADRFGRVVAVEGAEAAFSSLEAAGKAAGNIEAVREPAAEFLRTRELQRERPELVVLDPPRAGLGVNGAEALARIGAARVVYVSCDPTTLVRDLAVLCGPYRVNRVRMIDLFPQTFHIETVVHLSR